MGRVDVLASLVVDRIPVRTHGSGLHRAPPRCHERSRRRLRVVLAGAGSSHAGYHLMVSANWAMSIVRSPKEGDGSPATADALCEREMVGYRRSLIGGCSISWGLAAEGTSA